MQKYFRIVNPDTTCAGPKAGAGRVIQKCMYVLPNRSDRGLTGCDYLVDFPGFGLWILNEVEIEFISEQEYFIERLEDTFDTFKDYK